MSIIKSITSQIWVSSKREDADRKLGLRINQEMMVLPPADTTFVIISSDQDFRHYYQLLGSRGYEVIVVHNARNGSNWVQVLEMHTHRAYRWLDIMAGNVISRDEVLAHPIECHTGNSDRGEDRDSDRNEGGDRGEEELTTAQDEDNIAIFQTDKPSVNGSKKSDEKNSITNILIPTIPPGTNPRRKRTKKKKLNMTNIDPNKTSMARAGISNIDDRGVGLTQGPSVDGESVSNPAVEVGWTEGTVIRWRGTFGFLSVSTSDSPSFAHHNLLLSAEARGGDRDQDRGQDRDMGGERDGDKEVDRNGDMVGDKKGDKGGDGHGKCLAVPSNSVPTAAIPELCVSLRVYVHYKSLHFRPPVMFLTRGERVRVFVQHGDRGYFGGRVEPLILDLLP